MPVGCLLVGVGDFQEGFLGKGLADNLHPHRQPVGKAGRDRDARQPGDIYRQGTDVTEVHLEGVVHLLANLEGGGG